MAVIVVAAFAAAVAARGSVHHLLSGKDIAPNTIQSYHLVDHTIQARDLSPSLFVLGIVALWLAVGIAIVSGVDYYRKFSHVLNSPARI